MGFFKDIKSRLFGKKDISIEELEKAVAAGSVETAKTTEQTKEKKEDYQPRPDNDNTGMTSIMQISQKLDNIAAKLEEHDAKIAGKIDGLPKNVSDEIMPLLKQYRMAKTPVAKQTVADEVMKKMRLGVEELIDVGLVSIIKEYGQISSLELRNQALKRGICASASVYRHLEDLVASGKIKKERFKKRVLYTIPLTTREQKATTSEQKPAESQQKPEIQQESDNDNA